jgi:hypothetical protein
MKKNEVKIGGVYTAKVTNKVVEVRIDAVSRYGGWDGTNLATGKKVRIKSPTKLRADVGDALPAKAKKSKATQEGEVREERDTAQTVAAQAQNAVPTVVCPNCGGTELGEEGDCKKCHEPDIAKQSSTPEKPVKKMRIKKADADTPKRTSALDAAAMVLAETGQPMNAKEIVETALSKGYWKSPNGKTPQATLYSAMLREIIAKGDQARFRKTERGKFVRA